MIRAVLTIIAGFVLAAASALADAPPAISESARVRAARFFAAGLDQPLLELRRGSLLLQSCVTRLRRACSKEQRELSAGNRTLALLDELTLFRPPLLDDPAVGVTDAETLRTRLVTTGANLMRAAAEYDRALLARYGAVLRACAGDGGARQRDSLEQLATVDLRDFQALDGAAYEQAVHARAADETRATEALRGLSAEECQATLAMGGLLMEMLNGKLQPWTREDRRVGNVDREFDFNGALLAKPDETPTRDVAVSVAGNFVTVVATELQLTVYPETAPRIKAIAEAMGIHGN